MSAVFALSPNTIPLKSNSIDNNARQKNSSVLFFLKLDKKFKNHLFLLTTKIPKPEAMVVHIPLFCKPKMFSRQLNGVRFRIQWKRNFCNYFIKQTIQVGNGRHKPITRDIKDLSREKKFPLPLLTDKGKFNIIPRRSPENTKKIQLPRYHSANPMQTIIFYRTLSFKLQAEPHHVDDAKGRHCIDEKVQQKDRKQPVIRQRVN